MYKTRSLIFAAVIAVITPIQSFAQECTLGEVKWFAMNWVPQDYLPANGALLPISQYAALYSLMGTTYGGDGRTTFALPNLTGRTMIGQGNAPGLTPRIAGQMVGSEITTLNAAQLPAHAHNVPDDRIGAVNTGNVRSGPDATVVTAVGGATVTKPTTIAGGGQPVPIVQPSLVLTPSICSNGIYPTRP